ncbi:MAG: hypothetical protein KDE47_26090 [Caldilineaceae bacterium]|nr:hypothetical protein [Caldilineaceae bacterium]MCB0095427.1 hypothetical protein [Caldilineaceae bacterium]
MDQSQLIERKNQTRRQIEHAQRELAQLHQQTASATLTRAQQRQMARLETKLEALRSQEYNLRLAIDRTREQRARHVHK